MEIKNVPLIMHFMVIMFLLGVVEMEIHKNHVGAPPFDAGKSGQSRGPCK